MLTIHEITSAADAKRYYGQADYYSQGQETVGLWGGKLAEQLGLSGVVAKDAFDAMCDNLHPQTGERLTARMKDYRRVGYDFTVSVPKSVSIVRAFAMRDDAEALDFARDKAIAGMMAAVEADAGCRVRKGNANGDRVTGNLAWAAFHHTTSRPVEGQPPDMHEHTHLVCFNATFDAAERRIKAGQFGPLKRDGEYYAALFDSLFAAELEAMGFAIDRQGGKRWEIAGLPASLVATFSKRTSEVEAEAERRGITDASRKGELGAKTRAKKQKELTPSQLRKAWDSQLSESDREALAKVYHREIEPAQRVSAREAVSFAIEHLSEQRSVWAERELLAVALRHGLGQVPLEAIEAELPRQGVIVDVIAGRRMATTQALQEEENYLARVTAKGRGAAVPCGVPEGLSRDLCDGKSLNDGQWETTCGLLESSNAINVVEGPAGAGKSSMLAKVDEGWRRQGETATFLATTAPAVKVLQNDGFEATKTVAHFLRDERMQQAAKGGRVVIDEVSMLGHKDAVKLFKLAEKLDLKLVLVGDPLQHGSVPRGAFLRVIKQYGGLKSFRLTEIMRQQDAEYRAAAQLLSEGRTLEGFEAIDRKGWVMEIADDAERCKAMAGEYMQAVQGGESVLVVSPTHREAAAITAEIRSQLRQAGKLAEEEHAVTRLVEANLSEPEKRLRSSYQAGDVLIFHENGKGGFSKGQRLVVSDPARVPLAAAASFAVYRPEETQLSVGDKIRFTGTVKARDGSLLKNGDTHAVTKITRRTLRLDDGRSVDIAAGLFRLGWVETSFGAQGQSVQRVILGMSEASLAAISQEQSYVSVTRGIKKVTAYTDDKEALKGAIARSSQKLAALDVKPPVRPLPAKLRWWDRLRNYVDRLRRDEAIGRMWAANQAHEHQQERELNYGIGR